jgi:hypothetical protein
MIDKIKKFFTTILTFLGVVAIAEIARRFSKSDYVEQDSSHITDRIEEGEAKLEEIADSKPSVDSVVDAWNKDKKW